MVVFDLILLGYIFLFFFIKIIIHNTIWILLTLIVLNDYTDIKWKALFKFDQVNKHPEIYVFYQPIINKQNINIDER